MTDTKKILSKERTEILKQEIKNFSLCCLIRRKAKRLSEYKYRLEAWAENYKVKSQEKVNELEIELKILSEKWKEADHWGKYKACPHSLNHDGNGNYEAEQETDYLLAKHLKSVKCVN